MRTSSVPAGSEDAARRSWSSTVRNVGPTSATTPTPTPLSRGIARDVYTHAIIQAELVDWLRAHGHPDAVTEKRLDARSRVDVHCSPGAVIEVQLSGETDSSMRSRTSRYGGNVTWLYAQANTISSRDSALERDGVVLVVRLRPAASEIGWRPQTEFRGQRIDIGVEVSRTYGGGTRWCPLERLWDFRGGLARILLHLNGPTVSRPEADRALVGRVLQTRGSRLRGGH